MKTKFPLLCLAILFAAPAMAGVVFEIETTDHSAHQGNSETGTMHAAVEGRNLKMSFSAAERESDGEMIYRGDRREVVMVDHERKSYLMIDEEAIRSIGQQLSEIDAKMREALKDVPAERRAMVEQMMKQRMPAQTAPDAQAPIEFRNTGERDTKNGYDSVKYEVFRGGHKTQETWVTRWKNVEGGQEAFVAFQEMGAFLHEMRESMPSFGGSGDSENNIFEYLKEIDGYPVLTYDYAEDGSLEGEMSLRSSKRQTLDPAEFEPPKGYKRQQLPRR